VAERVDIAYHLLRHFLDQILKYFQDKDRDRVSLGRMKLN